jgi:hypothetical protein
MGMKINQDCWVQPLLVLFFRVLMLALQYFIKLGSDVGFAYQSPPPLYLTKAISENDGIESNSSR